MKKKIIPIILVCLSIILFIVAIVLLLKPNYFSFKNQTSNQETNENQIREEENQITIIPEKQEEQSTITKEETKKEQENINDTVTINQENEVKDSVIDNSTTESKKNENFVISYFSKEESSISSVNQDDRSLREKAKNVFTTVVDFIFYDKEIKGYTFKELTTSTKLKVIEIALSIDNKIDEYFPDYKDVIKDKYDNIKGKLAVKYLEFTSTLCEKVGTDTCNQAKENFNSMKENFSITWQLIKELASSGSTKVKDFYESWRDS